MEAQNARISVTMAFKGLIIGGSSQYHPEKLDLSITKTVDHIPGETSEQIQKRLDSMDLLEGLTISKVENTLANKITEVRAKMNS